MDNVRATGYAAAASWRLCVAGAGAGEDEGEGGAEGHSQEDSVAEIPKTLVTVLLGCGQRRGQSGRSRWVSAGKESALGRGKFRGRSAQTQGRGRTV
jgi:hypothetical protein